MRYKNYISWDEIHRLISILANKVRHDLPNIDSIYGIPRGGMVPAAMLAYELDLEWSNVMLPNTLVVDDICDSGDTIAKSAGVYTATLYTKESAIVQPTLFASILVNESQWIQFPWERDDAYMIQDYKK